MQHHPNLVATTSSISVAYARSENGKMKKIISAHAAGKILEKIVFKLEDMIH